jgi:hypothetical protein
VAGLGGEGRGAGQRDDSEGDEEFLEHGGDSFFRWFVFCESVSVWLSMQWPCQQ